MPHIRKAQAGSDSFGNTWDSDGSVVEVPHEQAEQLLAIDDAGFTLAEGPAVESDPDGDDDPDDGKENPEFSEVNPDVPTGSPEVDPEPLPEVEDKPKPAAKKTAARKTAASKPQE